MYIKGTVEHRLDHVDYGSIMLQFKRVWLIIQTVAWYAHMWYIVCTEVKSMRNNEINGFYTLHEYLSEYISTVCDLRAHKCTWLAFWIRNNFDHSVHTKINSSLGE